MRDFLIFRLAGPMAAFGEITVGERRSLWDAPSKSGVLGLVAACLGLTRGEDDALRALDQQLGFAVRVDRPGRPMRDYHTAQAPTEAARTRRAKAGLPLNTRQDELSADDLNTVLSERLYRLEMEATVALWVKPDRNEDLGRLQSALRHPVFTPYLGRKSCPLGAPPNPSILCADGLIAAFNTYDSQGRLARKALKVGYDPLDSADIWFEWDAGLETEETATKQVRRRRDALRQRSLWQFAERQEGRLSWTPPIVGAEAESAA